MLKDRLFIVTVVLAILLVIASSLPVQLVVNAAKYAQVGREILDSGDWVNLTIAGEAYDQKPPLLFWLAALTFQIFGLSVPAYKLAVILFSFLGLYSTFRLGKLLFNKETGFFATLFWGSSLAFLHFHNDIHTDTLMVNFIVFSVWQFMAYFEYKKWQQFTFGAIGIGLAMLTKGPVGLLIPAFVIGSKLLLNKQWSEIFHWRWILALLIIGIMILPAMIGLINQFGLEGIKFYFWTNNIGRVSGSYRGSNTDYFFYLHTSLYLLLPWTIFVLFAFFYEFRQILKNILRNNQTPSMPILISIILFVVILSLAKQKNPHYILSALPFIYILTAKWVVMWNNDAPSKLVNRVLEIINKTIALLLTVFLLLITLYVYPEKRIIYWFVYTAFFIPIIYLVFRKLNLKKQILILIFSSSLLLLTVNYSTLPAMLQFHTSIDAARTFNEEAPSGATLSIYGNEARLWNLFLYSTAPGRYFVTDNDLKQNFPKSGSWIYTSENGYHELLDLGIELEIVKVYTQHRSLTRQSIGFLNPKTRGKRFQTMYLVEIE